MDFSEKNISSEMTVAEWLNYWYNTYALRTIKQSTAVSYRGYINRHLIPVIGDIHVSDLNGNILQEFFNERYDNGNTRGGGLSAKSVHNLYLMLHKALDKACDVDIIRKNYVDCVELPKLIKPETNVLTVAEQHKLIMELKGTEEILGFGVTIALYTGMRLGEVLGLRWCDIDMCNDMIYVRRTVNRLPTLNGKTKTEIVIGTPKSQASIRNIPFTDCLKNEFVMQKEKNKALMGNRKPSEDDYVLQLRVGHPVEPKTMQMVFKRILRDAHIRDVNFHALRHTFATRAIECGMDVKTLSAILGHADVTTTLNRYAHTLDEHKRNAIATLMENFI